MLALAAGCAPYPAQESFEYLEMDARMTIERPVETVFDFATDPLNEHLWRSEVASFSADGPPAPGKVMTEWIDLGVVNGYMTRAVVTDFDPPHFLRVVSHPDHPRRLTSSRSFTALGPERTLVRLSIRADRRIARDLFPLPLAPAVYEWFYERIMHSYLARLRHRLETGRG